MKWKIKKECLDAIKEASKEMHPREFLALLSVNKENVIEEIVLLPQMIYGKKHATFNIYMAPIDKSIVGTVHSHPSGVAKPSEGDLYTFRKHGKVHIIIAYPYNDFSWKAYDYNGREIEIEVL